MKNLISNSLEETEKIAFEWLNDIAHQYSEMDEALFVGLSGHLGAGKTAFVKAVAKKLGIVEDVTSPTFVIMKSYKINHKIVEENNSDLVLKQTIPWQYLVHIDAYRLEKRQELEAIQWEKIVADKNNLIIMEWPENVELSEFAPLADLRFQILDDKHSISIS
ncbi:MAG: tRNA (adenosine(37)-N6)-threonylcarbamoyltransferase complex ATPase subunit type 1 TsaE [Candidatus Paceibacterota bacterium]|jgi:tRNA threonylcarbamoyladenosine biosynthesis protein TsaE